MPVQAVGNPPPEADQLRVEIEQQLPQIIASFSQVLKEQFGFEGIRVGGFTIIPEETVPEETTASISCNEEGCSID